MDCHRTNLDEFPSHSQNLAGWGDTKTTKTPNQLQRTVLTATEGPEKRNGQMWAAENEGNGVRDVSLKFQ